MDPASRTQPEALASVQVSFLPVDQVAKFGVAFDEAGDIRTARDNLPAPLPRLLQCYTNQISSDALAAKRVRYEGVLQNDALAFDTVAQKRRGAVPCPARRCDGPRRG